MSVRLLMLTLIGVLVCVRTLAYADPPDPTWIEGFWEDDDYDDVVFYTTSFSATETAPLCALRPHWTQVWIVPLRSEERRVGNECRSRWTAHQKEHKKVDKEVCK